MQTRSPFPGMDPWLEQRWGDVHNRLIGYILAEIEDRLPGDLAARLDERVFVEAQFQAPRPIYPDVCVIEQATAGSFETGPAESGAVAVAEPLRVEIEQEEVVETSVHIVEADNRERLITVIELLSAANKTKGDGQDKYLQKQRERRSAGVNLVEIDLLRGGDRVLMVGPQRVPPEYRTTYSICVFRGASPQFCEVYRAPLREKLPPIKVPLRPDDADIVLELQPLVDLAYHRGKYFRMDYSEDPTPRFSPEDAAWADALLKSAARR